MMKKLISTVTVLVLFSLCLSALVPGVKAAAVEDLYESSFDGDLLMTVDFSDTKNFESVIVSGKPIVQIDPQDGTKISVSNEQNKAQAMWGGTIPSLPLNDRTNYTIHYTVLRQGNEAFGLYIDSMYGVYGYPNKIRLMNGPSSLTGHGYVDFANVGLNVPAAPEPQEYVLEVCGVNQTLALYIRTTAGNYEQVDASNEGEIPAPGFALDNLGIFFYTYYSDQISVVSDVRIYRGLEFSGPVLPANTESESESESESEPESESATLAESESQTLAESASESDKQTEEPSETPDPENTKEPDKTTEAPKTPDKSGCSSAVVSGAATIVMAVCAAVALKKKK